MTDLCEHEPVNFLSFHSLSRRSPALSHVVLEVTKSGACSQPRSALEAFYNVSAFVSYLALAIAIGLGQCWITICQVKF